MKILFDYQAFVQRIGGVSRYHVELLLRLSDYGIDVKLPNIYSDNYYLQNHGIGHRNLPNIFGRFRPHFQSWLNQKICKHVISSGDYDVHHSTFVNPYGIKALNNKPLVVTVHDLIQEKTQRHDAVVTSQRRSEQLDRADAIICVSNQTKSDLLQFYPQCSDRPIFVVHHGCDQETPVLSHTAPFVKGRYVLYVGSREKYKNFRNMLTAFSTLENEVKLVCTGNSFSGDELRLIHKLGLDDRIIQSFVSDEELKNLYQYALAFIYPSTMEGFGMPILEAYRMQCPVICSDIECFNEIGGGNQLYFNPLEIESISETLKRICSDENLRNNLVENGNKRLKLFIWEESVKQHAEIYRGLI